MATRTETARTYGPQHRPINVSHDKPWERADTLNPYTGRHRAPEHVVSVFGSGHGYATAVCSCGEFREDGDGLNGARVNRLAIDHMFAHDGILEPAGGYVA